MGILPIKGQSSYFPPKMKSSSKVRFGIIGCSRIAKKAMLPAINDAELAEIGMIGSRSKERALDYCKKFGCSSYGNYKDVLSNDEIDAVYISLPVGMHEEWTIKAAESGKHVLCEKSSTTSLDSAKRMVEACRKNGVRLLEGFMFRYHPQHKRVISLVKQGALGDLLSFYGCFGFPFPDDNDPKLNKGLGGGSLNDSAAYAIYASRMIFEEEPLSVACRLKMDSKLGIDVKSDIFLAYANGKAAFISSAFGAYFQSTYSIWGSKSHLRVKRAYAVPKDMNTSIFLDADDKISEIIVEPEDHFRLMVDDFCREILNKGKNKKNFESDLLNQARVLEAARLSNREGRIVKISELP